MLLLGIDLGSSFVKASIIDGETGRLVGFGSSPSIEMTIARPKENWAEQDPELWWSNAVGAIHAAIAKKPAVANSIGAIGISYQMHGLVVVDKNQAVLRPSIIWCDSRAVQIGEDTFQALGPNYCNGNLLNSPGNFTASKLKWVKDNEPRVYERIYKAMLPGDYLAMRLTGEIATTDSGLSEGIMWDYQKQSLADRLFEHLKLDRSHIANVVPTFSLQGNLTDKAATELGLRKGIPIGYRAGDQPNNAFALNALQPWEMAATAGTSGVIYAVTDKPVADREGRVNTFLHVNNTKETPRLGVLMCVNGAGAMYSRLRRTMSSLKGELISYEHLNALAAQAPVGSDGLYFIPFGNGAERILKNKEPGASMHGLDHDRHHESHRCRATQEGIAFALAYGLELLRGMNMESKVIRAGHANLFLSEVFCETFANVSGVTLELYNTDGSQGAARGAGGGVGYYKTPREAVGSLTLIKAYGPGRDRSMCLEAFGTWKAILAKVNSG